MEVVISRGQERRVCQGPRVPLEIVGVRVVVLDADFGLLCWMSFNFPLVGSRHRTRGPPSP